MPWRQRLDRTGPRRAALPPTVQTRKQRRWFWGGLLAGVLFWLAILPFLGDPRISYVIEQVDGAATPVLVARGQFQLTAQAATATPAQPSGGGSPASAWVRPGLIQPVLRAAALPEVRAALGASDAPTWSAPTPMPAANQTARATAAPTVVPPLDTSFSYPEALAPGVPAATVAQVMNPTKGPLQAFFRPSITSEQDDRLCPALRAVIVAVEQGKAPRVVAAGTLKEMTDNTTPQMVLHARERYNLVVLVSVPQDAGNEYQGVSCTVDFMMQAEAQ